MNVSILVSTFDGYQMCWEPFCYGLRKYWHDVPYELAFITNHLLAPCGRSIRVGQDRGWANNLIEALKQTPTPYVIYAQEDYWLNKPVDTAQIRSYVELMEQDRADYIRLFPVPPPDEPFADDERLGVISTNSGYRASLQMALWRKEVLIDILKTDETGWAFELEGTIRSRKYGARFLSVKKARYGISYIFTAIVNGEWTKAAHEYAANEGIYVDFDALTPKRRMNRFRQSIRRNLYRHFKRFSHSGRRLASGR